jgi:hypothetical protein
MGGAAAVQTNSDNGQVNVIQEVFDSTVLLDLFCCGLSGGFPVAGGGLRWEREERKFGNGES